MKLKTFLTLSAVVSAFFGVLLLFFPNFMVETYGNAGANDGSVLYQNASFLARIYGTFMLTFAVLYWMIRKVPLSLARRAILAISVIGNVLAGIVWMEAILSGAMKPIGWSNAIFYLVFAAGHVYYFWQDHSMIRERELNEAVEAR